MMRVRSIARLFSRPALAACLLGLVAVGCMPGTLDPSLIGAGGSTGGSGGSSGGCDQIQEVLTGANGKCGSSACHGTGAATLDLQSAGVASRVVGVDAATTAASSAAMCEGRGKLIDQGTSPATGILIRKITLPSGDPNQCGARMPNIGTITTSERDCIIAWANAVAIQ